jgi:DNA-binding transcriptional MerR regulator
MTQYFRSGEFARRAGVTVRTLRYYDKIGLLKPGAYSESGQRLYTELDYARLGQILTLKLIGLSLDEIKGLLTSDMTQIGDLLERQKRALTEKARHLTAVLQAIEKAQAAMRDSQRLDFNQFIDIIQAVNRSEHMNWLDQFYTPEQQAALAARATNPPFADQRQVGEAWKSLFEDIRANLDKYLYDPAVQALVDRWDTLAGDLAAGDADLAAVFSDVYSQLETAMPDAPSEAAVWTSGLAEAAAFIERARAARK